MTAEMIRGLGVAAALVLAITVQALSPHARLRGSWRANATLWIVDAALIGLLCGACACAAARWAEARGFGLFHSLQAPPLLVVAVTILALDLISYAWHRANHVIPFLWRFHRVHHSDPTFTVSTAVRFHPGELLLSLPLRLAAGGAIGAPVAAVVAFEVVFAAANMLEHGDIDLPPRAETALGRFFITPALHRLHHSRRWDDLNTNFGTVLAVWDRLFRSYRPSSSRRRVETGLPDFRETPTLLRILLLPFLADADAEEGKSPNT